MLRFSNLGLCSLCGSILVLLLQSIASLTSVDMTWQRLRFGDIVDPAYCGWVKGITFFNVNAAITYILNLPLYLVLLCLTVVFFVISGIYEK